jgi:hypothetical protein
MNDSIWDQPGMVDRLRQEWAAGYSASEIGDRMGLRKGQVIGKVHRLKLPQRELPAALQNVKNKPRRLLVPARLGAAGVGGSRVAPAAHLNLVRVDASSSGPRAAAGSALVSSSLLATSAAGVSKPRPQLFPGRGCQFPMWGDRDRPAYGEARFCDAPARRNEAGNQDSPYCSEHHAKCFRPFEKKVAA